MAYALVWPPLENKIYHNDGVKTSIDQIMAEIWHILQVGR